MNKTSVILIAFAVLAVAGAFYLGRLSNPGPATTEPAGEGTIPPREKEPSTAPPGTTVEPPPLPKDDAPKVVRDTDRVRQTLKPGKTYQTTLQGTLQTRGTDAAWGIESTVWINYAFEAQIDREIVENDGEVIVEIRHFRDVRSVKIDTDLKDIRLKLGNAKGPILLGLGAIWPPAAWAVHQIDGLSTAPVLELLKSFGVDPAAYTGAKPRVFKMFTQFDGLTGKSVKLVYWNKEERTGVIQIVPLNGDMTESEKFLHHHSAVLSDALIFPEKKKVGEDWKVAGNNFSNLIDPGLRAAVGGELTLSRRADRKADGKDRVVLMADGGRLELNSSDPKEGRIGWFEPRGEMLFSPDDQVVIRAEMSGKGELERVSRNHLLFKTEMKQSPELSVLYTCRVIDTPAGGTK